ncbi:MAG TPA: glycosyltransferase family 4 protein, partial [Gemmatimonadales bacterium]|nr:glycosyltransferase family 4 protein [Gemmatimonadales bacterium]
MLHEPAPVVGYVLRKFPVLSETFILNEMLELEAQGVRLEIFTLRPTNDPRFHEDLSRLKARVTYVPGLDELTRLVRHHGRLARQHRRLYLRTLGFTASRFRPTLLWRFLQAGYIANEARRLRVTHLHAQFANHPTTVAMLAARLAEIPFSFTAHAMDIFKAQVDRQVLGRKIEAAQFVATVSEFNRTYLEDIAGPARQKIRLVPNGIDLQRFAPNGRPPASPFRILCVARLVEKKGHAVLLEACRLLKERGLDFQCDLVGKGALRPQLQAQIRRDDLQERVHLLGPATQGEVRAHYHRAHLYVLPCLVAADGNRDGLPVSLVEALACGLPVVSTPVTGIPEVVRDGENGLMVPSNDATALADAITGLIQNRDRYETLRQQARASVESRF